MQHRYEDKRKNVILSYYFINKYLKLIKSWDGYINKKMSLELDGEITNFNILIKKII